MTAYVLDTNIISFLMGNVANVTDRLEAVSTPDNLILGCPMVWYEVRRGLLAKDARLQMSLFERLFATFEWEDYQPVDWATAAELWAQRRSRGLPIQDGDLLIAVFALNRNAVLVTANEKDFTGLGVQIENWNIP